MSLCILVSLEPRELSQPVKENIAPSNGELQPASLHTLQALLLCVVYATHCLVSTFSVADKAVTLLVIFD